MTIWLLDDGPFGLLSRAVTPAWSWPASTLHLVHDVAMAAKNDQSGRRQMMLNLKDPNGAASITVHSIVVGSAASDFLWKHLRPSGSSATRDLGEDASISLCALQLPAAVFVTMDKGAAYQALAELGRSRVATPFDCWHDLRSSKLIDDACWKSLCSSTWKGGALAGQPRRYPV